MKVQHGKGKRDIARELRRSGHSINTICRAVNASKGSVSVWVSDIELTQEQKDELHRRRLASPGQLKGSLAVAEKAREGDPLHLVGCMLYWGEGTKHKNRLSFTKSDPDMVKFYVHFLRSSLNVKNADIRLHIHCYLGNGINQETIENFWLNALSLPKTCLRKTIVNSQPSSSNQKGRKLLYGVCKLSVSKTHLVQHVLGAIQEYTGIEKSAWLL